MTPAQARRAALEAAYLAGFNASGEGYNGEYPFGDNSRNPADDSNWCATRDDDIRALADQPAAPQVQERDMARNPSGVIPAASADQAAAPGAVEDVVTLVSAGELRALLDEVHRLRAERDEQDERITAILGGQEALRQQTVRIRRALLGLLPNEPDTREGVDTEEIAREFAAEREGMVLVPREPTEKMLTAGYAAAAFPRDPEICAAMWRAMYDAATPQTTAAKERT